MNYRSIFDKDLSLDEPTHSYKSLKYPELRFVSVTTFLKYFFEKFDTDAISQRVANKRFGDSSGQDIVLAEWKAIADAGTLTHKQIEDYVLDLDKHLASKGSHTITNYPTDCKAMHGIRWLHDACTNEMQFLRFYPEVKIYSEIYQIAGTIDLLIHSTISDQWVIVDWKTNKEITNRAWGNKTGTHTATKFLEDTKFNHYALQLSVYKHLLKVHYDINVNSLYVVHLLPEIDPHKSPLGVRLLEMPFLKYNVAGMLQYALELKERQLLFSPP